ncbi:hypothetical protein BDV95DRAFT_585130 [Massariosphaeria phaeospora]|uniref:Uncharacterized protein n=1 Tax=Massariosphaeria phaeospora TaxID=100035 RepID=A0A7C8I2A5_9PLEO|nr:hypothetical protein BDV95DRAFT_585130 [Massariosphaeria phaeospora]
MSTTSVTTFAIVFLFLSLGMENSHPPRHHQDSLAAKDYTYAPATTPYLRHPPSETELYAFPNPTIFHTHTFIPHVSPCRLRPRIRHTCVSLIFRHVSPPSNRTATLGNSLTRQPFNCPIMYPPFVLYLYLCTSPRCLHYLSPDLIPTNLPNYRHVRTTPHNHHYTRYNPPHRRQQHLRAHFKQPAGSAPHGARALVWRARGEQGLLGGSCRYGL